MNEDILKGQWLELKGGIKAKWRKLTDDDLNAVNGQSEKLMGILQTRYGYSQDKAREEYESFIDAHKQKVVYEIIPEPQRGKSEGLLGKFYTPTQFGENR